MRRLLFILLGFIACMASANAQIKYVEGSFRSTNTADIQAADNNLGKKNMTESFADFAGSYDDEDIPSAIIRVGFRNMAAEDIENHVEATVVPGHVNRIEYMRNPITKAMECWVHVDPMNSLILNITVDNNGSVRIANLKVESAKMYALEVMSDETTPVKFTSNIDGTSVWLDGAELDGLCGPGASVVKERVSMGTHHIKAAVGTRVREYDIEVSKANNSFDLDMKNRYKVDFRSNEPGVILMEGGKELGVMPLSAEIVEGTHSFTVRKTGYKDKDYNVKITGASTLQFDIHKNKVIDFYALSNNTDYKGASVYINNKLCGQTPLQMELPYGRYHVRMSAMGRDKTAGLIVDDDTPSRFMLKLPAQHRRFNPFDIDFHKREFGFAGGYVQKWLHLSDGVQTAGVNYFGEEAHMHGFQVGVPIQPVFGYGLGLNTGLYFEGYFANWRDTDSYEDISMTEMCLYMPVDFMFRLPLGENFSIYATGGIGIDWSIETTLSSDGYDDWKIDYSEEGAPNHFNFSAEFGGGIQYKALQVSANYQIGLNNNSKIVNDGVTAKLRKIGIQIALMF